MRWIKLDQDVWHEPNMDTGTGDRLRQNAKCGLVFVGCTSD